MVLIHPGQSQKNCNQQQNHTNGYRPMHKPVQAGKLIRIHKNIILNVLSKQTLPCGELVHIPQQ